MKVGVGMSATMTPGFIVDQNPATSVRPKCHWSMNLYTVSPKDLGTMVCSGLTPPHPPALHKQLSFNFHTYIDGFNLLFTV